MAAGEGVAAWRDVKQERCRSPGQGKKDRESRGWLLDYGEVKGKGSQTPTFSKARVCRSRTKNCLFQDSPIWTTTWLASKGQGLTGPIKSLPAIFLLSLSLQNVWLRKCMERVGEEGGGSFKGKISDEGEQRNVGSKITFCTRYKSHGYRSGKKCW